MTDRISINGLVVEGRVGVTEEERSTPQLLVIDLELAVDLSTASRSDDLNDTIDYAIVTGTVATLVARTERKLLERLAAEIGDELSAFTGVLGVTVRVMKQHVPVDERVSEVAVAISRGDI